MLSQIKDFLHQRPVITLSPTENESIRKSRKVVLDVIERGDVVYGINTGFGKLSHVRIPNDQLQELQVNLLRSHACGVGELVSETIVTIMMYLKIKNLARGYSGCSPEVVKKLTELLNKNILPVIPKKGSVGASGDLAPLAHMSLPLIGEGEVIYNSERMLAEKLVQDNVYQPMELGPKDGLSLINGTQYSTAMLVYAYFEARKIMTMAKLAVSMSIEADMATDVPFRPEIHKVRNQIGQQKVAANILKLLTDSEIVDSHKNCEKVQDPYCYRCASQVLGGLEDMLNYVEGILENEVNAVTDNPLVFPDSGKIYSGGNFHAEPIALAADYLTIALTEAGNISERRIANLTDTTMSGLPAFLVESSGLNSGFMIAQVTAAALTAENRTFSNPASVENISTSANQEDHVSMAPNAANKLLQVVENVKQIIWIEMMAAAQGIDFRRPLKSGKGAKKGYDKVRSLVKYLEKDRTMFTDLRQYKVLYADEKFIHEIEKIIQ